jgi:hypothetical protein
MRVALILLTWKRVAHLPASLALLAQQSDQDFAAYVLNNNPDAREAVDRAVAGCPRPVEVVHWPHNGGVMARHELAGALKDQYDYFLFIDDDLLFTHQFVRTLKAEAAPDEIVGWWAWSIGLRYWNRHRVAPGAAAGYVGGGATIVPAALYDERFFAIPDHFRDLDDLWMSAQFQARGGRLRASRAHACMEIHDDHALVNRVAVMKNRFCAELRGAYGYPRVSLRAEMGYWSEKLRAIARTGPVAYFRPARRALSPARR